MPEVRRMENWDWKTFHIYHIVQPIYDLKKEKILGFEFLLRSPDFQSPEHLFEYAEREDALFDLDMYSVFHIFEQIRRFSQYLQEHLLFINIFPSTLLDSTFIYSLDRLLTFSAINPANIVLEINEAENELDLLALKEFAEQLRKRGVKLSLDDLGTGSSTLQALLELEPDITKVDRYFAKDLATSQKKQDLIEFFVDFIGNGSKLIVEGIESQQDLDRAKKLGVAYGQGFYIGIPKTLDEYLLA